MGLKSVPSPTAAHHSAHGGPARLNSSSTIDSISTGTSRIPAYQRALDHSQSSALATKKKSRRPWAVFVWVASDKTPDPNGINLKPIPSICDEWASTWLARIHIQGLKLMPFGSMGECFRLFHGPENNSRLCP